MKRVGGVDHYMYTVGPVADWRAKRGREGLRGAERD